MQSGLSARAPPGTRPQHGALPRPSVEPWESNPPSTRKLAEQPFWEDGRTAVQPCSGMAQTGATEFKSRGSVLLAGPRWPPVSPGLAADLAASSRADASVP